MTPDFLVQDFRLEACKRMRENTEKILSCLTHFDDRSVWERVNGNSLSVANQLLHLSGNITQYILSGLDGQPDQRRRDEEFDTRSGFTKQELTERFCKVADAAMAVTINCTLEDLTRVRRVQGFELSGLGMILHVVEHWSYHTGQIVAWTKQRTDRQMGFYDGVDLNTPND